MKKVLIALIRFYQRTISAKSPPVCRFTPTCSAYAIQAIERFGVIKGSGLAIWRILRCNPFGKYGYDPVPEKKTKEKKKRGVNPPHNGAGDEIVRPCGKTAGGHSGKEVPHGDGPSHQTHSAGMDKES